MKDEIITGIILFLLIGLFVYNSYVIDNCSQRVIDAINIAEQEALSNNAKYSEFDEVLKLWEKEKKALFYICGHELILQIDENINLSCEYIAIKDAQRAVLALKKARIMLEDLAEREKIRLDNIL